MRLQPFGQLARVMRRLAGLMSARLDTGVLEYSMREPHTGHLGRGRFANSDRVYSRSRSIPSGRPVDGLMVTWLNDSLSSACVPDQAHHTTTPRTTVRVVA